jgi:hypothetical protein
MKLKFYNSYTMLELAVCVKTIYNVTVFKVDVSYDIYYTGIRLKPFTREDTDVNGYEKPKLMQSNWSNIFLYHSNTVC